MRPPRRPTFSLLISALAACNEYDLSGKEPSPGADSDPGIPDIAVRPAALDLGALPVGGEAAGTVRIANEGGAPLTLADRLEIAGGAFSVSALEATEIAPGDQTEVIVTFAPDAPGEAAGALRISSDDPDEPTVEVPLSGRAGAPDIEILPATHDFGTLEPGASATQEVTIRNAGDAPLTLSDLRWISASAEFSLSLPAPQPLAPGDALTVPVTYAPADDHPDEGSITVRSDDPDEPESGSNLYGNGRLFQGFATGWYIVDDSTSYETTSNPAYIVDYHGDSDGYWYEPSGAHGLTGSADPAADFATLRSYVIARAGAPTPVTGPLTFRSTSGVPALSYASYSYIVCDFWIDPAEDPAIYEVSTGTVDDGLRVIVNGVVLGDVLLGNSGRFSLSGVGLPGQVNTLAVILMDNAAVDKYVYDLAFYRGGVIVSG